MDQVEFRALRDKLNNESEGKYIMIKNKDTWTWIKVDENINLESENLEGIEYNEVRPDWMKDLGHLLGFIYIGHNCPACLGFGRRREEEIKLLKYIWKQQNEIYNNRQQDE